MDSEQATLIAAVIAAGASFLALIGTVLAARSADLRAAQRLALSESLSELGGLLYEIVALSTKMTQAKSDEKFAEIRKNAIETAGRIDDLRRSTRYALWGIDGGFRIMKWIPVYIAHYKQERHGERATEIIKKGTRLREAMDKAISSAYYSGKRPSPYRRVRVWWAARDLRTYFDEGKPQLDSPLDEL